MSVRIVYQDIAAGAEDNARVTAPGAADFAQPDLLPFGGSGAAIASLEPYSWLLDESREILDGQPIAYWSETVSGPDGRFEEPPELIIDFDGRYTSPGLFLTFDMAAGDYCTALAVEWYRGGNRIAQGRFFPTGTEAFCAKTVEVYDRLVLRFQATNRPYRHVKLRKIMFGVAREFQREELRNVNVVQEVSIISDQVAVNTLHFTLDSQSDVDYMFQLKQPMYAYDGAILIGVFYIEDSRQRGKGLYDVSCKDAVGVLDDDPFPAGMYQAHPAKQLLEEILGGSFPLELDAALIGAAVTGYLPPGSRRAALQQVAFALCAMVDTSGTEAVRVYRDREDMPRVYPAGRIYTGGSVEKAAIVTAVQVTAHSYTASGGGGETVEVDGTVYTHSRETSAIANPNVTASDKANVIEVKEATLVHPGNVFGVVQHLYSYYAKRDRQSVRIVMDGERPGDHVAIATPWGTVVDGYIVSMRITLSGIAAADCEIVGTDVRSTGVTEEIVSGELESGEV